MLKHDEGKKRDVVREVAFGLFCQSERGNA